MKKQNNRIINKNKILLYPIILALLAVLVMLINSFCESYNIRLFNFDVPTHTNIKQASTDNGWNLIVVNFENRVPDDYEVEFTVLSNGEKVDKRIYPDLQNMMDDARDDGLSLFVADGYRSYETQEDVYINKYDYYRDIGYSKTDAKQMTEYYVAIPGTSEHQIGIAVDINADKKLCTNEEVYDWLWENSWKYGFIKRYPENKTRYTGILNEPWHYRYVGKEAAKEIYEQGICLEEYVELIK